MVKLQSMCSTASWQIQKLPTSSKVRTRPGYDPDPRRLKGFSRVSGAFTGAQSEQLNRLLCFCDLIFQLAVITLLLQRGVTMAVRGSTVLNQ